MNKSIRKVVTPIIIGIYFVSFLLGSASFAMAEPGDETIYYFLTDHLGSIDVVLDEEGNVVERRDYLPYGNERTTEGADSGTDHKFTGKELDDETGLYYYGARYYDPLIGRFVSIDPWGGNLTDPQSLNKYSYTFNNPLKFTDPTGRSSLFLVIPSVAEVITVAVEAVIVAYMMTNVVDDVVDNGIIVDPAQTESDSTNTSDNTTVPPSVTNTGNEIPIVQSPTNTGDDIPSTPDVSIITTPAYQPENTGSCGQNMSCAVPDQHDLGPLFGTPNSTRLRWSEGQIIQGRTFDENGNPVVDTDLTDHGNPALHPEIPHTHEWDNDSETGEFKRQDTDTSTNN